MLGLVALLGCGPAGPEESAVDTDEGDAEDEVTGPDCEAAEIRVDGDDPPSVGDRWNIFLWCGDTLLTGAMVVRFEPGDVAKLDENVATFVAVGESKLLVQVGRFDASRLVTVGE